MTLTFPYPLAFLSDVIRSGDVAFDLMRRDEMSGSGDGRVWTAELAKPIWQVSVALPPYFASYGREIDAKVRGLQGSKQAFLFADPSYAPAAGVAPGAGVTLSSVASDRTRISLTGLPPSYPVRAGDRFSITWGAGRIYLGEFAESITGGSGGNLANIAISPWLPIGIAAGALLELAKPIVKVFVPPGGHKPFASALGGIATGGSLTLLQRI